MMVKLVAFLKRKPGIGREQFAQRWVESHANHRPAPGPTSRRPPTPRRQEEFQDVPSHIWIGANPKPSRAADVRRGCRVAGGTDPITGVAAL